MNTRTTLLSAALLAALASHAAHAAGGYTDVYNSGVQAQAAGNYWTAERLANAKTLLPTRPGSAIQSQSYGSAVLDFTRSRIVPQTANKSKPYRMAGKLYFTIPGQGDFQCSAAVIKKRLVLTAAHCMYSAGVGFHTNWTFIPAFDGTATTPRPYGTWNWTYGIVPNNWISTSGALPNNTDFGLLVVADQVPPGGTAVKTVSGTVGSFTTALNHLADTHVSMLGYPCNFDSCLIMQRNDSSDHRTSGVTGSTAYEYGSDMTGGSSGGPWVENLGDPNAAAPTGGYATRNAIVAVTSYGYNDPNVRILGASALNADFTTILNAACGQAAGNC